MSDYKILTEYSIHTLEHVVMGFLSSGYSLAGGPFIKTEIKYSSSDMNDYSIKEIKKTHVEYCQAVYKN